MATGAKDNTQIRVRSTFGILIFATLILALFQSQSLISWSYDLPEGKIAIWLVEKFEIWDNWMENLGLSGVSRSIQDLVHSWQDLSF